ncbi:MAG: SpoIIIAH-like family protein [Firmicutes bacterium]|nr:SpoIIIAH-like family protein [Bacillota bacterium]
MLSKKKKIVILSGMVALLVVTGVLNIVLNNRVKETQGGGQQQEFQSLFMTYRTDRAATRDQTMLYLDAIIASDASSSEAIAAAEEQKLSLTRNMEVELALEGLIKAVGFDDAFITMSTENVNVIIKADALTEDEANRILAIIVDETGRSAQNVIVIPLSTNR